MRFKMLMAVLVTMAVGEAHFAKGSYPAIESARERLARREKCMQLENSKALPACREFLDPGVPGEEQSAGTAIQFCESINPVDAPPCRCMPNGVDVECTFRICGYRERVLSRLNLPRFAAHVAEELSSWRSKSLVSTKFVGFADGTAWGDEKKPKPQPISGFLKGCLARATRENKKAMSGLGEPDYLDAELALLRGCALEEELTLDIGGFEFDSTPVFSFDSRSVGLSDPKTRAAELKVVAANSCRRLRYGRTR